MLAGYDDNGPQLYQIDPSGTFFAWKASAIGKNMMNAKTFLEKRYSEDVEVEDAVHTALLTLKESFEGEMTGDNVEVCAPLPQLCAPRLELWCRHLDACMLTARALLCVCYNKALLCVAPTTHGGT